MDYTSLAITILAFIVTIISFLLGKKTKKLILKEKNMLADKVSDFKTTFKRYADRLYNDRKTFKDDSRNTVHIRIEDIEGIIRNLNRFERSLRDVSNKKEESNKEEKEKESNNN